MATNCRTRRQGDISMYRHLFTAFAMVMAIANGQVEAAGNHTSIAGIGPARWPSTTDPFHKHSGHVLKREGSVLYDELDLLSTKTPSVTNSDIHFNGTLYHYTSEGSNEAIDSSTIVLMSCDGAHAKNTFIRAATEKPKAVIFYTNEGNCCIFNSSYWQLIGPDRPLLFTIANMKVINPPDISGYELATSGTDVQVEYWAHFDADTSSPITAYETPTHEDKDKEKSSAMLIVYIIVSLISAGFVSVMLFLGIKACQRYGGEPTQHLRARPRQSRARGIARAALDALPVVKFGAKPLETTPKDVEMQDGASSLGTGGSTMELRAENGEHVVTTSLSQERVQDMAASTTVEMTSSQTPPPPAYTPTKGPEVPAAEPDPNQVRCPVCLDDFEADQEVRVLPCSHSFHTDCIDPWLLNVAGSCPLCRIDLRSPEERERDNLANILPPPPPALTSRPRSSSVRSGRLQALLDVARGNSSREERLAALRAVRNETGNGNVGRAPRSRRPELGVSRLRRAVFGNGGSDSDSAVDRVPSLRTENSTAGLAQAGAPPGVHSPSSSTAGLG